MFWNSAPPGLGTGTGIEVFEFDLACGPRSRYWKWLLCTVPRRGTWADQNHMCVCGLAAEELPLAHIVRSALCMLKLFSPHSSGWCNATSTHGTFSLSKQFWHDVYYSAVVETDVEQWNFVFPKATLFNCFSTGHRGGVEPLPKRIRVYEPNMDNGRLLKGYRES